MDMPEGLTLPVATEEEEEDLAELSEEYLADQAEAERAERAERAEVERAEREEVEEFLRHLDRQAEESRRGAPVIPRFKRRPLPQKLWQAVAERRRRERISLDLICLTCRDFIPKSEILEILCHFFPPGGCWGSPITRCYFECPHCTDDIVLGRNVGDADNFRIIGGAFPADASGNWLENASGSGPTPRDEAYPDALLDSPNDIPQAAKSSTGFVVY